MTLAFILDYTSYVIFAVTVSIIIYKVIELWTNKLKNSMMLDLLQLTSVEFKQKLISLETGLTTLSVIASAAPFIGLMGTVLHIMDALSKVSMSLDASIISGPIATALNSTLVGLSSAVPAASAHGYISRKLYIIRQGYELAKEK